MKTGTLTGIFLRGRAWGIGAGAFLSLATSSGRAEIELIDVQGRKATVEVVETTVETVVFTMPGRRGSLKLKDLSEASRAEVIAYAKAKGVHRSFPAFTAQVKIVNQRRNDPKSWYKRNIRLVSSFVLEGSAKLVPLPAAEATMILITQDTREKYVNRVEKLQVHSVDSVTVPAAPSGDRREFEFKTVELRLDAARDTTNVGGKEYKYYLFGLRDAETKKLVDFQTNHPGLQRYVSQHPETRDKLLESQEKSAFSTDFAKN